MFFMIRNNPFVKTGPLAVVLCLMSVVAYGQLSDDEDKPVDEDTGDSTIKERTLGILPNPLERWGIKFAATYIGDALINTTGGVRPGAGVAGRLNLAADIDFEKASGAKALAFMETSSQFTETVSQIAIFKASWARADSKDGRRFGCSKLGSSKSSSMTVFQSALANSPLIPNLSTLSLAAFSPMRHSHGQRPLQLTYRAAVRRRQSQHLACGSARSLPITSPE